MAYSQPMTYATGSAAALSYLGLDKTASTALRRRLKLVQSGAQGEYSYRLPSGRPLAVISARPTSYTPPGEAGVSRSDNFTTIRGLGRQLYGDILRLEGALHSDHRVSAPAAKTWLRLGKHAPFELTENTSAPVRLGRNELNYGNSGPAFSIRSTLERQTPRNLIKTELHPQDVLDLRGDSMDDFIKSYNQGTERRWAEILQGAGLPPAEVSLADQMVRRSLPSVDTPDSRLVGRRDDYGKDWASDKRMRRIAEIKAALRDKKT